LAVVVGGRLGVRRATIDGTTCSRAGVLVELAAVVLAADAEACARCRVTRRYPSHPPPPRTASTTTSSTSRRRQ
jgi:hypothetical protein